MKDLSETVRGELRRSEDYRYAYDEEFANTRMATQIKVLRESHDPPLTQKQLAEEAGMKQSRISELENVAYSSWSISTLRRLARALGVRLAFEFESWGELLPEIDRLSRETLIRPSFEHDPAFQTDSTGARKEEAIVNKPRPTASDTVSFLDEIPSEGRTWQHFVLEGEGRSSTHNPQRGLFPVAVEALTTSIRAEPSQRSSTATNAMTQTGETEHVRGTATGTR